MNLIIKKNELDRLLKIEQMSALDLYELWSHKYEFKITYVTFNKLLNNRITWKISYGFALLELFGVSADELFEWDK